MKIGRYELLTELGEGGMATLHLARRLGPDQFQKPVAIKRIHEELSKDAEVANRFLDEARLAARIIHPNVVQIFDFNRENGVPYIAMEYVHGCDLMALFERVPEVPEAGYHWSHAARMVAAAAAGLHAAHELMGDDGQPLHLVHRDVSPQNILLTFDGHVKVTDFGIAHAVGRLSQTLMGLVIGKVAYMSPEQCRGLPLDRRSDVFALGVVLHELVTLKRLFRAYNDQQTMQRVLTGKVPSLRTIAPSAPPALEAIVSRALALDPAARFQTAAELQEALEQLLVTEGILMNAGRLQELMSALFRREKAQRDEILARLYRKTIVPVPAVVPASRSRNEPTRPAKNGAGAMLSRPTPLTGEDAEVTAPPEDSDAWGQAAAATIKDMAPPAVVHPSGGRRTRVGFEGPLEEGSYPPPVVGGAAARRPAWPDDVGVLANHGTLAGRPAMPDTRTAAGAETLAAPGAPDNGSAPAAHGVGTPYPEGEAPGAPAPGPPSPMPRPPSPSVSGSLEAGAEEAVMRPRSWPYAVVLGAVVLGAVVALIWIIQRRESAELDAAPPPPTAERSTAPQVTVRVRVSPASARLWVGDEEWTRDKGAHERAIQVAVGSPPLSLRLEADGYVPAERTVTPSRDQIVEVRLELVAALRRGLRTIRPRGSTLGPAGRPSAPPSGMRSASEGSGDPFEEGIPPP